MTLSVVSRNVQWATPRSERSPEILRRISDHCPEIICLTEADAGLLQADGYTICSQPDYGLGIVRNRRKVLLWSRQPWVKIDRLENAPWTVGRFVSGVTDTPLGRVAVMGICIPWSQSRTKRFGGQRQAWQDHENYLDSLTALLTRAATPRTIVMGDFNQPIGQRGNVPARLRAKLRCAIPPGMTVATAGVVCRGKRTIDHIALSTDLFADSLGVINNLRDDGKPLSDHFGIVTNLSSRIPAREPSTEE